MLNEVLDVLAPGWVGSLIGLLGIAAAGITYVLSRQRSIISYRTRGVRLLGHAESKLPKEVSVQYRGRDIPRLTRSVVVLWNDGEKTITGADIVGEDPIRIDTGADSSVVACTLLRATRPVLQAACQPSAQDANTVIVTFGFLDPSDGLVVELLHTGQERHPKVLGTIRGIPQGPKNRGRVVSQRPQMREMPFNRSRKTFATIVVVVGVLVSLSGILLPLFDQQGPTAKTAVPRYALLSAGALYAGLGCLVLWRLRRRYPRALHSEELE